MKVKNTNFKVAVFAVATVALGAASSVNFMQNIYLQSNNQDISVYAAEGRKIAINSATGTIESKDIQVSSHHVDTLNLSIRLADANIQAGDYVEIKFNNINASRETFDNREIRINDEIIGSLKFAGGHALGGGMGFDDLPLGAGTLSYTYNLVFNENMAKYKDRNIEISSENLLSWQAKTTKDYELIQSVVVADNLVASKKIQVKAVNPTPPSYPYVAFDRVWLSTDDGETIKTNGIVVNITQQYRHPENRLRAGDIVEYNIPSNFGVAFDEEVGREILYSEPMNTYSEFDKINPQGVISNNQKPTITKVIEASPHRVKVQIIEIEGDAYEGLSTLRSKILDTSPKTINYNESKLVEAMGVTRVIREGQEIHKDERNIFGQITGAKMKSYGQIRKRGSVIRQIIDENGNKIEGLESDKLILERVQEGTAYHVEAPQIEGYVFKRLAVDSSEQKGVVEEGVKNVILVYGRPNIQKEENKSEEIQAPNTGFSGGISALALSALSLLGTATLLVRKR